MGMCPEDTRVRVVDLRHPRKRTVGMEGTPHRRMHLHMYQQQRRGHRERLLRRRWMPRRREGACRMYRPTTRMRAMYRPTSGCRRSMCLHPCRPRVIQDLHPHPVLRMVLLMVPRMVLRVGTGTAHMPGRLEDSWVGLDPTLAVPIRTCRCSLRMLFMERDLHRLERWW